MFGASHFKRLLEPGRIGSVATRNRMIKNGTHLFYHDKPGGYMGQRNIDFYDVLARGGVGLIVAASAPLGLEAPVGYRIDRDEYIPGFAELARTTHRHGCPASVRLFRLGPMQPSFLPGEPAAASSLPKNESPRPQFAKARELTVPEIGDIVNEFARAAQRIQEAGLDGIELNGATNHLLNSFPSRAWNRRGVWGNNAPGAGYRHEGREKRDPQSGYDRDSHANAAEYRVPKKAGGERP
jgi:2,4-dienoyl-CoA reductase (NADPH2)